MAALLKPLGLTLLLALASGCTLFQEPQPRQVEGATDGYLATSQFLKVYVRSNRSGDLIMVDFDRRDWWVSKIAERIDAHGVGYLTAEATPRAVLNEYLVDVVVRPADLERYRYASMAATHEEKALMDAEYDALLARLAEEAVASDAPSAPSQPFVPALPRP